ncbi:MAG: GMC family oxidoreductase [Deltaproteobacteria bacterium]|nr:GMC family oxidoreductase [Deltaproteobacteria bacterium]
MMIVQGNEVKHDISETVDVAVVGSGCGGATVAKELAAAGLSVAMVEQGGYYSARHGDFDQREDDMLIRLDGGRGFTTTSNGQITLQYGNCVGGASVHYWADSWRTPRDRCERFAGLGVEGHSHEELAPYFDRIEHDLNIHPATPDLYNTMNLTFDQGARRLGWEVEPVHQARRGCMRSGYCMQGCAYNAKQSQLVTHIPAALAGGAKLFADCRVEHILTAGGQATGLSAVFLDRRRNRPGPYRLHLRSKVVVLAAGGFNSAVILLRNRLGGPAVGKQLFGNPCPMLFALYDKDIVMWRNIPAATGTMRFRLQRMDGRRYLEGGYLLHPNQLQPALLAAVLPGLGLEHRALMEQAPRIGSCIAWIDDENPGRITLDRQHRPRYHYEIRGLDELKIRDAFKKQALLLLASGAKEVIVPDRLGTRVKDEKQIAALDRVDIRAGSMMFAAPHPAGAARMGRDPLFSVIDSNHECHHLKRLFVCDGSAFPGPLSVDPSLTIMAWSYVAANYIKTNWDRYKA